MNVNEIYQSNSDYLKATDIPAGREAKVIIAACAMVQMDNNGEKQTKLALSFHGKEKKLLLNKTNAGTISHVHGPDTDNWIEKEIIMFSTQVDFAGQMVDAIRLRVVKPIPPGQEENFDDDIPF